MTIFIALAVVAFVGALFFSSLHSSFIARWFLCFGFLVAGGLIAVHYFDLTVPAFLNS
jgi:hypothetical protein